MQWHVAVSVVTTLATKPHSSWVDVGAAVTVTNVAQRRKAQEVRNFIVLIWFVECF